MILPGRTSILTLALIAAAGVSANAQLTAHWTFGEGAGASAPDQIAGNDGTVNVDTAWSTDVPTTGFANNFSLQFDGSDDYVSTAYQGVGGSDPRTVAFWIRTSVPDSDAHGIVGWGVSTANHQKWHMRLNNSAGNGPLGAIRTETQGDFSIGSTALNDGQWHHVAVVYPGGGENGTVLHYVDGVLEAAGGNGGSTNTVNTNTAGDPFTIGRRTQGAADNYFGGLIDDVRIYDNALSAGDVAGLSGANPTTAGLLSHYSFEEGSGLTTADTGSNGLDGTLTGMVTSVPGIGWSADAPTGLSGSIAFDGTSGLETGYEGIGGGDSRTVALWMRSDQLADAGLVGWGDSGANGEKFHVRVNSNAADGTLGGLRIETQGARLIGDTVITDDEWHHLAVVYDGDSDEYSLYVDGLLDGQGTLAVPTNTDLSAGDVTLGYRTQGATDLYFDGNMADVRIYGEALDAGAIAALAGIPEPGTGALCGLGALAMALRRRRR